MNQQWPKEQHAENQEVYTDPAFKTAQDFLDLLDLVPDVLPEAFNDVVSWILEQGGDLSELEKHSVSVDDQFATTIQDSHTMWMTVACAASLAQAPTLTTWAKVRQFTYHSFQLEHWLSEAMMAYTKVFPSSSRAYVQLANDVFSALDNFSLPSMSDRINDERVGAWASWSERTDKLEELWWGLRGWHGFMNYNEELSLFQVFYKLEPDEYIRTISRSSNPYLVSALLFVAGIGAFSPRFSEWKRIVALAPIAFEDDGNWNGSVLIPLLLVEARDQLLHICPLSSQDAKASEIEELKLDIANIADLITSILDKRQDASGLFSRWAPWLMRQILGQTTKGISDVTSTAFADDTLLEAISTKLHDHPLPQKTPDGTPLWEAWCYRCALASFAHNGHIEVPGWRSFADEWNLSHDDWPGEKGHLLRNHASYISSTNTDIPGIAANLLAFPITKSASPVDVWIDLWEKAFTLREIVEFGDPDVGEGEYRSRSEAGRLLLLLFNIGLAIFDQLAADSSDINSPEARSLAKLFQALTSASSEMREIDSTLNHDKWLAIVQHLAVRRVIWEPSSRHENSSTGVQIFRVDDSPTTADVISSASGDVMETAAILQSLLLNTSDSRLKAELDSASIDLPGILHSIRSLNKCHSRKYPIDEAQLRKLEALTSEVPN
jgi:hypothetical protein